MNVLGIIPARYGSTRLPGKPLKEICGKPMIQHVYERACRAELLDKVIVATDDQRIIDSVKGFGGDVMLTSDDHPTGSSRIAEVAEAFDCDIVVNIQGDEPLILPEIIDEITEVLLKDPKQVMATGCFRIDDEQVSQDPNVVKVVRNLKGAAMLFSRSVIPYPRNVESFEVYEHIGIYAYTKRFLMHFIGLPDTPLSTTESLEQLKAMEHGYDIIVIPTKFAYNALSVDTQEDLETVTRIMTEEGSRYDL